MIAYSSIAHAGYLFYAFLGEGGGDVLVSRYPAVSRFRREVSDIQERDGRRSADLRKAKGARFRAGALVITSNPQTSGDDRC